MLTRLGNTDLHVSRLCQGTAFRNLPRADDPRSERTLRHALENGVNFFDTAAAYGWGGAESLLGKVIAGQRDKVVILTKAPASYPPEATGGASRPAVFTEAFLDEQVDASLRRLQTDYIDLYLLHQPDRNTPVEKLAEIMQGLVRSGRIRYWGVSNFSALRVQELLEFSTGNGHAPLAVIEDYHNIAGTGLDDLGRSRTRVLEEEMFPVLRKYGIGLVAFSPMDTGRLAPGREIDASSSLAELILEIDAVARELGVTRAQVCVAWVLSHPEVSCVLAGSESPAHVDENLAGTRLRMPQEALIRLNAASRRFREQVETQAQR